MESNLQNVVGSIGHSLLFLPLHDNYLMEQEIPLTVFRYDRREMLMLIAVYIPLRVAHPLVGDWYSRYTTYVAG
jgi:hypothetical protein